MDDRTAERKFSARLKSSDAVMSELQADVLLKKFSASAAISENPGGRRGSDPGRLTLGLEENRCVLR